MIKSELRVITKRGLRYVVDATGRATRYQSWMGALTAPLYDMSMARSVFPRLFEADQQRHQQILRDAMDYVKGKRVLEVGAGSGSVASFLPPDNIYVGLDVSPALLRRAQRVLMRAGFDDPVFYVASGDDLPFADGVFDVCLCILTLNFVPDPVACVAEMSRVLAPGGFMLCAVPVPERNKAGTTIHGTLYAETELARLCAEHDLRYDLLAYANGALLYFRAWR